MSVNDDLYRVSPEYRRLADDHIALQRAHGALQSAYLNALSDQSRLAGRASELAQSISRVLAHYAGILRDDPGRGGSGGEGTAPP